MRKSYLIFVEGKKTFCKSVGKYKRKSIKYCQIQKE